MKSQTPPTNDWTICGDIHAENGNLDKVETLFDIFEELGNPTILLGDLQDTREIIRGKTLNLLRKRIKESKLTFVILVGNHDWFSEIDCNEHSLESLKDLPNVHVIDRPTILQGMAFMPYYNDLKAFNKALGEFPGCDQIFIHQGVVGFDYGNGRIADGKGRGEITLQNLKKFKRVISGHFHKFAQDKNLTFLGTPFSHDFGETDQTKYIAIYNQDTDELELLKTPFPRHRTVELELGHNPQEDVARAFQENKADILRIRLVGTEMQINSVDKSQFPDVKLLDEPTDADQIETSQVDDNDSNERKFLQWGQEIKKLDDETIKLGLDILGEAV